MRATITAFFFLFLLCANAQRNEIVDKQIKTLQVVADDNWLDMPVIELNSHSRINISFDDLTHVYRRLCYRIEHCEADWTMSDQLFESDFVSGFASGNVIDDIEESVNTNILYTHYSLSLPNRDCRIKMSGNYRVTIYDDNDDERPLLRVCFLVVEPIVGVQLAVTSNTDVDINHSHQQIVMQINYGNLRVVDHERQIKTVLLQNGRWSDARINAKPQYVSADGLRWEHCRQFIFDGGNEYHKFEMLDPTHATLGIDNIVWDGTNYHAFLFSDMPRYNYIYDHDANGSFYIRNSDNIENDISTEYIYVHFKMIADRRYDDDVFLNATWTNDEFSRQYQMDYDYSDHSYNATVLLKQGYYSYQYLLCDQQGNTRVVPCEGNFYQTNNSYQALIYYREQGGRTDRLVGFGDISL